MGSLGAVVCRPRTVGVEGGAASWGNWAVPESELGLLETLGPGADVVELGCGTGALCAWLARLGFKAVGVDISRSQLNTAAELQKELGLWFPLLHANAESLHYADESFDCAISEYGASLWCDPYRWLPEAGRVLRPDGRLIFVTNSPMLMAATPRRGPCWRPTRSRYFTSAASSSRATAQSSSCVHGSGQLLRAEDSYSKKLIETRPLPRPSRGSSSRRPTGHDAGPARRSGSRASLYRSRVRKGRLGSPCSAPPSRTSSPSSRSCPGSDDGRHSGSRSTCSRRGRGRARARTRDRGREGARALLPRVREPHRGRALRGVRRRAARSDGDLRRRAARRRRLGRAHG